MNERIDDLIALAAFGELTEAERTELDAAAAANPAVAAELAAALDTAATLLASTQTTPPATLRSSVLDAIASTPQERDDQSSSDAVAPVTSMTQARERRARRLAPMLSAAAAVVLVAVGSIVLLNRDDDTNQFAAVAEASDAQQRTFAGDLVGTLRVVHSPSENAIVVDGVDLPPIAADKAYVLWFITGDAAVPVAEFRPDPDGAVQERFDDLDPGDVVLGITEEPVGGSATPTLPILATA